MWELYDVTLLVIVSFKFYVMNFVEIVIDFYLHITSHVSQAFASCTHDMSYSLLNVVHVIVCVFGLTNRVCKYFEFLCKTNLMLENLWKMFENLNFGKLGLKLLFLKNISSHTHAFCSSISMLWGVSKMCLCYFQKLCFFLKNFVSLCLIRLIQSVFRSIEIVLKVLRKPLSVSIDPICFSINRKCFKIFKEAFVCFD